MHAYWQNALGVWMILSMNLGVATKGMHLWIWILQMHNANNLITVLHISRTNVQHVILMVKKVTSHANFILKCKIFILQDLHSPSTNHDHHCITSIRYQGDHKVFVAHLAHIGVTITILIPLNTGMCPHCYSLQYLHYSICVHLQQVPCGVHVHHNLDQKLIMGTPVTETLTPVIGWISTTALSKLLHLPLRCFNSLFTALLDCGASHDFISEDLVNRISTVTPTKVNPMPVQLAD